MHLKRCKKDDIAGEEESKGVIGNKRKTVHN